MKGARKEVKDMVNDERNLTLRKIEELFIVFLGTSVIGWLYEVSLDIFVYRTGYSNRSELLGPYCVIYGAGILLIILLLGNLIKRKIYAGNINITPFIIFILIIVIASVVELIGTYVMEIIQGGWSWDYTDYWGNFQGRIAPNPSIRFGIGGMVLLYILRPAFLKAMNALKPRHLHIITGILCAIFVVDCIIFFLK